MSTLFTPDKNVPQFVPGSLAPFFQEYEISNFSPEKDAHTIIERTLQFGNRAELRWLFEAYGETKIREWVQRFGQESLPQPHLNFWQIILETKP
jgi:hypothetical protein